MNKNYFTLGSLDIFILASFAWCIGAYELWDTFANFSTQWYWYVLATFYTMTLNELYSHRICSHTVLRLDPSRITYKILTFLTTVDHGWGPVTSVCLTHKNHHLYADQDGRDNLNWRMYWYTVCTLSPLTYIYQIASEYPDEKRFFDDQRKQFAHLVNDPWTNFCEDYRTILTILFWTVLYFTIPIVLFKIVMMGRFLLSIYTGMAAIGGHAKIPFGYRNWNTPDNSYNNLLFHYLALGSFSSMLQNNHHWRPSATHYRNRWFEFDTGYPVFKLLKPLLEKSKS